MVDSSFYYETNLDRNIGYILIGSNTDDPDAFSAKVKEMLLGTTKDSIEEEQFSLMKKKIYWRSSPRNEFFWNSSPTNISIIKPCILIFFELLPIVQALTIDDINQYLKNWVTEKQLAVCEIVPN
ncbi:hypothetical protein RWE15_21475 [Virgibacillus halophilus]|uniref:Uncharacterized protein n=1 Tax=Tigheibacillus halophilus TaxID=361280 RepID=A0ABU5CB28_9BACI|nr:hypothetical protein [Virgibacillus halophilus]